MNPIISIDDLNIIIQEIEDHFSICLQSYNLDDIAQGDLHLKICIDLINALNLYGSTDMIKLGKYLLTRIEDMYLNQSYTIFLS